MVGRNRAVAGAGLGVDQRYGPIRSDGMGREILHRLVEIIDERPVFSATHDATVGNLPFNTQRFLQQKAQRRPAGERIRIGIVVQQDLDALGA